VIFLSARDGALQLSNFPGARRTCQATAARIHPKKKKEPKLADEEADNAAFASLMPCLAFTLARMVYKRM
jgi:hypothetical protein